MVVNLQWRGIIRPGVSISEPGCQRPIRLIYHSILASSNGDLAFCARAPCLLLGGPSLDAEKMDSNSRDASSPNISVVGRMTDDGAAFFLSRRSAISTFLLTQRRQKLW